MTVLLLDLEVGGVVYRIATDAVDVPHAATGLTYSYAAGLGDVSVASVLDFLSTTATYPSVPIRCTFPGDVAALLARGIDIARSNVEIAAWEDGDDYDDREVLAAGQASDPTFGSVGEPVAFSIERLARSSDLTVPSQSQVVDGTTHPDTILTLAPADLGIAYPIVFGQPYAVENAVFVPGSQGVWSGVDDASTESELVIAGVAVDQQFVYLSTDSISVRLFPVYTRLDGRGQQIAFVPEYSDWPTNTVYAGQVIDGQTCFGLKYSASGNQEFNPQPNTTLAIWVTWYSPTGGSGGLSPLAGDVIRHMLDQAGLPNSGFDAPALAAYSFDCVIDAPSKPAEWLAANVYPVLPITITEVGGVLSPVIWRYGATSSDVEARLDVDGGSAISRAGPVTVESGDVANRITLRYRYSVQAGHHCGTATRGDDANPDAYCLASQAKYGVLERTIDTAVVYSEATAQLILSWYARAYAFPRTRVRYMVPRSYQLRPGQVVSCTDSELSFTARLALVSEVQIDGSNTDGVELLLIADPIRDTLEV